MPIHCVKNIFSGHLKVVFIHPFCLFLWHFCNTDILEYDVNPGIHLVAEFSARSVSVIFSGRFRKIMR